VSQRRIWGGFLLGGHKPRLDTAAALVERGGDGQQFCAEFVLGDAKACCEAVAVWGDVHPVLQQGA
jgi:hypothetical protein